jgi:hypothetical protein
MCRSHPQKIPFEATTFKKTALIKQKNDLQQQVVFFVFGLSNGNSRDRKVKMFYIPGQKCKGSILQYDEYPYDILY